MRKLPAAMALLGLAAIAPVAQAADVDCELRYNLTGWSAFYSTAEGAGTIHCDNGTTIPVKIEAKGGGLTVGKKRITDGKGRFSAVPSTSELLGTYVAAEAHASAAKASGAQVMTKGDVSLALAGTGEGWSLGVGFGGFTITRR